MWAEPSLEPVYAAVRSYLEMDQRVGLLTERLSVIGDLLAVLKDQVGTKHGEYLEWIGKSHLRPIFSLAVGAGLQYRCAVLTLSFSHRPYRRRDPCCSNQYRCGLVRRRRLNGCSPKVPGNRRMESYPASERSRGHRRHRHGRESACLLGKGAIRRNSCIAF